MVTGFDKAHSYIVQCRYNTLRKFVDLPSALRYTVPHAVIIQARRILRRPELHYTPKHASGLNMVEIEIRAGDVFHVSPRHDTRVVGDEPYVSLALHGCGRLRSEVAGIQTMQSLGVQIMQQSRNS
jgi:hypothetical protein